MNNGDFRARVLDGTATPIKTHSLCRPTEKSDSAILILRNPLDTLRAEYKRRNLGKTGQLGKVRLTGKWRLVNTIICTSGARVQQGL